MNIFSALHRTVPKTPAGSYAELRDKVIAEIQVAKRKNWRWASIDGFIESNDSTHTCYDRKAVKDIINELLNSPFEVEYNYYNHEVSSLFHIVIRW